MAVHRLSDAQKQALLGRFRDGENTQVLADQYGCSANTVTRIVKALLSPLAYEELKRSRQRRAGGLVAAATTESIQSLLQPELSLGVASPGIAAIAAQGTDSCPDTALPAAELAEQEANRQLAAAAALPTGESADPAALVVAPDSETGATGAVPEATPVSGGSTGRAEPLAQASGGGGAYRVDGVRGAADADRCERDLEFSHGEADRHGADRSNPAASECQAGMAADDDLDTLDKDNFDQDDFDPDDLEADDLEAGDLVFDDLESGELEVADIETDDIQAANLEDDNLEEDDLEGNELEEDDFDCEPDDEDDADRDDPVGLPPRRVALAPNAICDVIPWSTAKIPDSGYLLVDKTVELQALPLSEIPDLGSLAPEEQQRQALVVYTNPRQAKRLCGRSQRVIKLPDTQVLARTAPYLLAQGISRIVIEGSLYALPER